MIVATSRGGECNMALNIERRISQRRQTIIAERRDQLVACAEAVAKLAKHREIKAVHARDVRHDLEIRRVLDTIVRRWTLPIPTSFISTGSARTSGAERHREHVVPSRVLVDRMIMNPSECRALLDTAVIIASVTPAEHQSLGGIFTHHEELYNRMLAADVSQLPSLGQERYLNSKVKIQPTSEGPARSTQRWNWESFFAALKELSDPKTIQVAQTLAAWMKRNGEIEFGSGARDGSMTMVVGGCGPLCRIWTFGRFVVFFENLMGTTAFKEEAKRVELRDRLNQIDGINFTEDMITRRWRNNTMGELFEGTRLKVLLAVMDWVVSELNI